MSKIIFAFALFRRSFLVLLRNDPLRLGGATAFFALFALPPILLILTTLFGVLFRGAIGNGEIFKHLSLLIGEKSALGVQIVLMNIVRLADNTFLVIGGSVFLLFVSTTLFQVIKNSFHQLWRIRYIRHTTHGRGLKDRLLSLAFILLTGLLFIFGVLSEFGLAYLQRVLQDFGHSFNVTGLQSLNTFVSIALFAVWFALLFRFLPYVRIDWRAILVGAFVTSVLFSIGTFLMSIFLVNSNLGSIYGAAGSLVVLLLFVFYSALILYFGAAFVWVYAEASNLPITLKSYAARYAITDAN